MSDTGAPPTMIGSMPATEPVEATEADRIAAAYIGQRFAKWTERQVEVTLAGEGDEYPMVQALARHRLGMCQRA